MGFGRTRAGVRRVVKETGKAALFAFTPLLGVLFLPLRLLDRFRPDNRLTLLVARTVNRLYPPWFRAAAAGETDLEYVRSREHSAATNMIRYGVPLDCRRMLEVGCGTGAKTAVYDHLPTRPLAVGCDTDEESLLVGTRSLVDGPPVVRSMPYVLPFRASMFDLVLCEEVLEHVAEPARLLAEIRRVLAPGGAALFLVGPLYAHAKGPHLHHVLNVMWPHLLFSHSSLAKLLRALPSPPGLLRTERTLAVFESLNRLGETDYLRALRGSELMLESYRTESEYGWLAGLPLVGRLYRKSIRAVLRKPCESA